ncbi:nonribosomal peptide synthetase [Phlyctema vagabunda]|uniref:Nonribosomal peptide synthetase n=1 Tax=Phlyctema vagabunda TaxID=108571 RepID=A0ABR4PNH9_9HELO
MGSYFKTDPENLYELLELAALDPQNNGISFISPKAADSVNRRLSYKELFDQAREDACLLANLGGLQPNSVILLHFDNHYDGIRWLWAVLVAGYLPAISTPFTQDLVLRKKHIIHLQNLLEDPLILTSSHLLSEFDTVDGLNLRTIEQFEKSRNELENGVSKGYWVYSGARKTENDLAILMLTSGSTGNSKAVGLRHGQMLKSVAGKSYHHSTNPNDVFLNWIGLDHVANLTESHLHGMHLAVEQFHVQASDLLVNPLKFLSLISKFRVTHSFAPNFFLASLRSALEKPGAFEPGKEPNLSCFRVLISGGEANVVETSVALTQLLAAYKVKGEIVRPGFGMTETCAGSIYSLECPSYDVANAHEFASLGSCIPGLELRVSDDEGQLAAANQIGNLELHGPILFQEYFNNPIATAESFTSDGWFRTGDRALIDSNGKLNLTGRAKESIIINGVKYFPHELETAVEAAKIGGITPSYTVVFPHRPKGHQTEVLCVVYLPAYESSDPDSRLAVTDAIAKVSIIQCGIRPYQIIPLTKSLLPKSSLGKLSRAKIRTAFENGEYAFYQETNNSIIKEHRLSKRKGPTNEIESQILDVFVEQFELDELEIGTDTSLFEMGVSSIEIIQLKTLIQKRLDLDVEIPVITMMTNPTVRELSLALSKLREPHVYSPIVVLQAYGNKIPLFLIHPGVGEILVFLNLAKFIVDRPVYAIRARGFDGEPFFEDLQEVISTYHKAIKEIQPEGPYAIAGYSYGSMVAFEITKVLERNGDRVGFLGVFNLPPHIKFRMRQLDWTEVILNLSFFLGLITEEYAHEISAEMHKLTRSEALDFIISKAPPARMIEMALDRQKLTTWANLANQMQFLGQNYEPEGKAELMDVFYAIPLVAVASNKHEWRENHLNKWAEFVETPVRFHEVDGAHYTMISPENVLSFQRTLRLALERRGL